MNSVRDLLIVDDDHNMRSTLAAILAEDGLDVRVAASGEEAVALCLDQAFRLILMDVRMPGIDGVEACRRIRSKSRRSQIVIMSAQAESEMERLALRAGVLGFLRKPLDVESVIKLIGEATSRLIVHVGPIGPGARRLQQALSDARVRSTFVGTIDEALALIEQIHYDALVLDLEGNDDPEGAVAYIRDYHPNLPLLLVAPGGALRLVLGVNGILEKPVSPEGLLTLLDRVKSEQTGRHD
jgi:CheY-like chemotaxis protein